MHEDLSYSLSRHLSVVSPLPERNDIALRRAPVMFHEIFSINDVEVGAKA